ncbi:biliverdin-producing heme oxygenase [Jiella pacifica]|uniref:Biliverdin-producing heme oxygenase n=1 Tax=Jiella pacifica TaxID=2696469 RepID=A0A6N9TBI4_9HYPH|nr:biliverdin-producing heme oxygenase [Jiella pacifica]NDW07585.1 biliverdin-producing heme oxygenase [Jiella pacifica]
MNLQVPGIVAEERGRSQRLKAATHATHDRLDAAIMAAEPFRDRENYGRFLAVQHGFHAQIDPLFSHEGLQALLADLKDRRRLDLIRRDAADLGLPLPAAVPAIPSEPVDTATALGWLYVAEGSNIGAAFLLKHAAKLGLSETFGARHLAGAPEGRARHWRSFTAALDAVDLGAEEDAHVVAGAEAAFRHVRAMVDEVFG